MGMELDLSKKEEEILPGKYAPAKFGMGNSNYTLIVDSTQASVEEKYFWMIRYLESKIPYGRDYFGNRGRIMKVKDVYTAGETSSYWGSIEQRRAAQIDKFQQIMANVGNMLKALFQLLRELRIMDERLDYYERGYKGEEAAEVSLKSIWVDMVEGGAKNPGSVTGLSLQLGMVTLPDFFYTVHPKKVEDVEKEVEKLKEGAVNRKVREILARKLKQYMIWKEKTYRELKIGRDFKLKYMRQHYYVIKLYLNWLRPYLNNIQRLQMKESWSDRDIITAFETSKIQLEVLAIKEKYELETLYGNKEERDFKYFFPCVQIKIDFVAIPELAFQQDFQRGAVHRGRSIITVRGLVVTQKDLNDYLKKLEEDDLKLLASVDESILALKDDLEYYLEKAGDIKKDEVKEEKGATVVEPFKAIFLGFKELLGIPDVGKKKEGGRPPKGEEGEAKKVASLDAYLAYKIFKQAHGMLTE
ncbi:MAG: hypothetical protein AABY07_10310 [Nanoarchaeota archaeon]|mgnify:CR=1 FL=1